MAVGNAIVTTAKFKPLTVAEWAAPLKEYAEQHLAAEEALADLSDKASEYERYIRENPNSDVAKQYNNYIGEIERQADLLAQQGINPTLRTNLVSLRRDYKSKIQPVQEVVERYKEDEKTVRDLQSKGLGYIGKDLDINDYFENPNYHYSYILGDKVTNDFSKAFTALSSSTVTSPEFQKAANNSQYWQIMTSQGYNQADILNAVINNPELAPEIYNAIPAELRDTTTKLRAKYNYDNLSAEEQQAFDTYAYQGALSGIKQTSYSLQQNRGYESPSVALQTRKYEEAEKQKNKIIKQEIKDEAGNLIGNYYTFNGEMIENIGTEDNPKWIYYGTATESNPDGVPIGYKAPSYKDPNSTTSTSWTASNGYSLSNADYNEALGGMTDKLQLIDGEFSSVDEIPSKKGKVYNNYNELPDEVLNKLTTAQQAIVERGMNEGKFSVIAVKDGVYIQKIK